jgi:hypothetical protein
VHSAFGQYGWSVYGYSNMVLYCPFDSGQHLRIQFMWAVKVVFEDDKVYSSWT